MLWSVFALKIRFDVTTICAWPGPPTSLQGHITHPTLSWWQYLLCENWSVGWVINGLYEFSWVLTCVNFTLWVIKGQGWKLDETSYAWWSSWWVITIPYEVSWVLTTFWWLQPLGLGLHPLAILEVLWDFIKISDSSSYWPRIGMWEGCQVCWVACGVWYCHYYLIIHSPQ